FDSKPWPDFADGGGPSLELKNPWADNAVPEAWAASDESSRSTWRRYSFTNTAITPVFAPGDVFHELRLGLLDAGEVLLDNVSVVESPAGTAHELLQNPSFTASADKWRFYGTHSHSVVIPNPTNAANNVLRLVATGRSSYLDDRIETT